MDIPLIAAAGLMGLAGAPHCAAMCGAPCAAVTQRCGTTHRHTLMAGFTVGRLLSYAAGGAAVVASVGAARTPIETIADSFGALQIPVIGGLFPSPL